MKREVGIDLLRLLSMFMVVLLHVLGHGGILSHAVTGTVNYNVAWLMEIAAYCAANVFAMITGYLMIQSKFKGERLFGVWFQTFFYSFGISLVFFILDPLSIGKTGLLLSLFPIMTNTYWYVTSYVGLFFFIPILNTAIKILSKRQAITGLLLVIVLFTLVPMISGNDLFALGSGYSTLWLILMYAVGAVIQQWALFSTQKKRFALALYGVSVAIVFTKIMVIDVLIVKYLRTPSWTFTFLSYTSPFIFLSSVGLFLLVIKIKVKNTLAVKTLTFLSPLAFGVYLFSEHPLIWKTFLAEKFVNLVDYPVYIMVLLVLLSTLAVFVISLGVEFLRSTLFKIAKIDQAIVWCSKKSGALLDKVAQAIEARS